MSKGIVTAINQMKEIHHTQGKSGNWDHSEYMRGLYNGMELMLAIVEGRNPKYKDEGQKLEHVNIEPETLDELQDSDHRCYVCDAPATKATRIITEARGTPEAFQIIKQLITHRCDKHPFKAEDIEVIDIHAPLGDTKAREIFMMNMQAKQEKPEVKIVENFSVETQPAKEQD